MYVGFCTSIDEGLYLVSNLGKLKPYDMRVGSQSRLVGGLPDSQMKRMSARLRGEEQNKKVSFIEWGDRGMCVCVYIYINVLSLNRGALI